MAKTDPSLIPESADIALWHDAEDAPWHTIPEHCRYGLAAYVCHGQRVGHFLTAVLSNNLREAVSRADDTNMVALHHYIRFLYGYAPSGCWGSTEKVVAWLREGGLTGRAEAHAKNNAEEPASHG